MNLPDLTARNQAFDNKPAHIDRLFANEDDYLGYSDKIEPPQEHAVAERPMLRKRRRLSNTIAESFVDESEATTDVEMITYLRSFEKPDPPITGE